MRKSNLDRETGMNIVHRMTFGLLCKAVRLLLRLRYKVKVKGFDKVLSLKGSYPGILFLPNHPAEIDPVILMSVIGPDFFPRSVVVEHFYYLKWFKKILDFSRVIPIPCLEESAGGWKKKQLTRSLERIQKEIVTGENYIIYPAGKLKHGAKEKIGGASFVHTLVRNNPKIPIALVRITGLWGSSFSTYGKNTSPDFGRTLAKGFKELLKAGLFFLPKRAVTLEFEIAEGLARAEDRLTFNRNLESWYNRYPDEGEEKALLVPYSFWHKKEDVEKEARFVGDESPVEIDPRIESEVITHIASLSKTPKQKIARASYLAFDLGLDSLDLADIQAFLDKRYDVRIDSLKTLEKVSDILKVIAEKNRGTGAEKKQDVKVITGWFESRKRKRLAFSKAGVISEAFLDNCDRMGSLTACADANAGALSYKQCKKIVLILADRFKRLPGEKVGVLLPSSVSTYLSVLALLLAGKVPVMLNWTGGRTGLNHAKKIADFQSTITSKKFLNKLSTEDFGDVEDTFVFLEEVKEELTVVQKLKGLFLSLYPSKALMKRFGACKDPEKPAVVLFTSGTESLPKAVPLYHRHLLSNQKAAFALSGLTEEDSLHGVLPPFHSFGFSLTGLFPLLCGLKVFYAPDPTDGFGMGFDIRDMKLTTICLAPSFIRNLFAVTDPAVLQSLRLIVSGAEKPSPDLPVFVKENLPLADWREGYGITECSPIVSLQPRKGEPKGVGQVLQGLEVCVINPVSLEKLSEGSEGEFCIWGDGVFDGYLNVQSDPFIMIDGKRWYRSGDIGRIDGQKNIYLIDRLKRTIKIGGEMISLAHVEQELLHATKDFFRYTSFELGSGPYLALVATRSEKPELVLFTVIDLSVEEVNRALRESGASRLVKIARTITVPLIPLTGTGKVHYRELEEKLGV